MLRLVLHTIRKNLEIIIYVIKLCFFRLSKYIKSIVDNLRFSGLIWHLGCYYWQSERPRHFLFFWDRKCCIFGTRNTEGDTRRRITSSSQLTSGPKSLQRYHVKSTSIIMHLHLNQFEQTNYFLSNSFKYSIRSFFVWMLNVKVRYFFCQKVFLNYYYFLKKFTKEAKKQK